MQADTPHLENRAGHWHYNRRVPARFAAYDDRGRIKISLKTTSLETARQRRDAMVEADDLYWASLSGLEDGGPNERGIEAMHFIAQRRYNAASKKNIAFSSYGNAPDGELKDKVSLGVDPAGQDWAVQINIPTLPKTENGLSAAGQDNTGKMYLIRQGELHQNRISERIREEDFIKSSGLKAVDVHLDGAATKRRWFKSALTSCIGCCEDYGPESAIGINCGLHSA